jgi:tRNA(His) 5'-end guanylyltransferase
MDLGDRMKAYEETFRQKLPIRMPAVVRLDGKAFHTLTRGCEKPFDAGLQGAMREGIIAVLEEMPARLAYAQSDEVSFLLIDYNKFDSEQWFDGNVQKIASVTASIMGAHFTKAYGKPGYFDGRVFVVPERDIVNYFIWRQRDCVRNSISACAQAQFSPKQLHGKNSDQMKEMLAGIGKPYDAVDSMWRLGTVSTRGESMAAPNFSTDREFLKKFLTVEEE